MRLRARRRRVGVRGVVGIMITMGSRMRLGILESRRGRGRGRGRFW